MLIVTLQKKLKRNLKVIFIEIFRIIVQDYKFITSSAPARVKDSGEGGKKFIFIRDGVITGFGSDQPKANKDRYG